MLIGKNIPFFSAKLQNVLAVNMEFIAVSSLVSTSGS